MESLIGAHRDRRHSLFTREKLKKTRAVYLRPNHSAINHLAPDFGLEKGKWFAGRGKPYSNSLFPMVIILDGYSEIGTPVLFDLFREFV